LSTLLGVMLNKRQLDYAMREMDSNGDGCVAFPEFQNWWQSHEADGGLFPVMKMSVAKLTATSSRIFLAGAEMSLQPFKIFISYWQIAGQIGNVLHFQFPPMLRELIAFFKPLVAAIHGLVALECAGVTGGFYTAWILEVFIIPGVLYAFIFIHYLLRRRSIGHRAAAAKATNDAFFVLFIIYPLLCNKLFKMLDCRQLSPDFSVLASDYSIDCYTERHDLFYLMSTILIVVFSLGVPLTMGILIRRNRAAKKKHFETPEWQYITRRMATRLAQNDLMSIKNCIVDVKLGVEYGALVAAFKVCPRYY
jgi:hypothetical protein